MTLAPACQYRAAFFRLRPDGVRVAAQGTGTPVNIALLVAIAASATLIGVGALVPAFTFDTLFTSEDRVSILRGAFEAMLQDQFFIGLVVILFSAVFPAIKLAGLTLVVVNVRGAADRRVLRWLEALGKWSMLDVFVVATMVGAARLGFLSDVSANEGVYIFGAGILLSLIVTAVVAERYRMSDVELQSEQRRPAGLILALLALGLLMGAVSLPIFRIEKFLLSNEFSLLISPLEMIGQGEFFLPFVIYAFVILLPLLRILSLAVAGAMSTPPRFVINLTYRLGRWAMLDVYVLAMGVVLTKLGDVANYDLLAGFWLLLACAAASGAASYLFTSRLQHQRVDER